MDIKSRNKYHAVRSSRVGKVIGDVLYIHKSAFDTLLEEENKLVLQKQSCILNTFKYDIIKIDIKHQKVTFIQSEDWDTANEPSVGAYVCVPGNNAPKYYKATTLIYHHKWMFVKDNYEGFNVEQSKKHSEFWMNHPYVLEQKSNKNEKFSSKIGYSEYWNTKVIPFLVPYEQGNNE